MTVSTYDNAPPVAGWSPQPGRHCGQNCVDFACPVCGEYVPEPLVDLGEN